ncbi:MAG: ParA family protein, partial [Pseudomonadota bacterium]
PEGQTRRVMRDQLQKLRSAYDLIVIDCPPGISIFAEAGVACSDLIVMPTIPDYLSTLGLRELNRKFLRQLRRDGNLSGRTAILPTKVQGNNLAHQQYLERLEALVRSGEIDATLFGCVISYSQTIARALDSQHLGESFKTKYRAATTDLTQFAEEVKGLLDDTPAAGQSPDAAHNAA